MRPDQPEEQPAVTVDRPLNFDADADDDVLWGNLRAWAGMHHIGGNRAAAESVLSWAKAKGLTS